jgi:hypothetical protein
MILRKKKRRREKITPGDVRSGDRAFRPVLMNENGKEGQMAARRPRPEERKKTTPERKV